MARARRQVADALRLVDAVLELVDARIPAASRNPILAELIGQKPRLIVMTREDMADRGVTREWIDYFARRGQPAIAVDARGGRGLSRLGPVVRELAEPTVEKWNKRGIRNRAIRTLVLGIPNVGKSSLINRLAGRSAARTGDLPGVTRNQQWIRTTAGFELLDTPGILWPKFEDPETGLLLAATGAIKEEVLPLEEVAVFLLKTLWTSYPSALVDRYGGLSGTPAEWLEQIGKARGLLAGGGRVNISAAAELVCREFRTGRLGRISLQRPPAAPNGSRPATGSGGEDAVRDQTVCPKEGGTG